MAEVKFSYGPLNRIINVHWAGGGTFVAGTDRPFTEGQPPAVLYAQIKNKSSAAEAWRKLGPFSFGEFGRIWAGAYHDPVYLLGGDDGGANLGGGREQGVLMRSTNGRDWTEVHRVPIPDEEFYIDSSIVAIVWDESEKAFYAEGTVFENGRPTGPQQVNTLYRSDNQGNNWTEVESKTYIFTTDNDEAEKQGLIVPHCSGAVKDWRNVPVPGGIYGRSDSVLIAPSNPAYVNYASGNVQSGSETTVKITTEKGSKIVATPVQDVSSVAYAGGLWIAAGGVTRRQIALSDDNGDTWTMVYDTPEVVGGIIMTAVGKSK